MSAERTLGDILGEALGHKPDPLVRAGRGESEAQRELAEFSYRAAQEEGGLRSLILAVEALTYSRLAAVDGERSDLCGAVFLYGEIAKLCRRLGDHAAADEMEALGVAMAEAMAEEGDEEMAAMLSEAAAKVSPQAMRRACELRREAAESVH